MSIRFRWHHLALVGALGAGMALLSAPVRAAEAVSSSPSISGQDECEVGQVREGERCMHRIAPPAGCAGGGDAGGGGGGGCYLVGDASTRFSPTDVAAGPGPVGFSPGPPGPGPGPNLQPGDLTGGGGVVSSGGLTPPAQAPVFRPVQQPPRPDPLPGLIIR